MPNNNYSLSLSAQVSAAGLVALQTQLDNWAKSYTMQINAAIQNVQQAATQATASTGATGSVVSAGASNNAAKVAEGIVKMNAAVAQLDATQGAYNETQKTTDNLTGQVVRATLKYTDAQGELVNRTVTLNQKSGEFRDRTKEVTGGISNASEATRSWIADLGNALEKIVLWAAATGLIYGSLKALKDGIQYIKDLNVEMTKIQQLGVSGAGTSDQINSLAKSFNQLASSMGSSTIEISNVSSEFLRQGYSIEQSQKLVRSALELSKLGNLDLAESTDNLIATMNGFGMTADEVENSVSKLIAIDNIAATSAGELATGLQYVSAVAKQTGISFDQVTAMIATASSRTRLSAEMIGTAYRSMLTRMGQVKAGADVDDFGESLNNVEKVLRNFGIELRDQTDGTFKPFGGVIDDIASKWQGWNNVQQSQIATAIAGQRQAQIFLATLNNYGDVQKYIATETNSAGLAQQRYAIYQDNVEASINRSKAAWEGFWQVTTKSDNIKGFYDLSAAIGKIATNMGGLIPILGVAVGLFIALNGSAVTGAFISLGNKIASVTEGLIALTIAEEGATAGATALSVASGIGIVVAIISAAVVAFNLLRLSATQALEDINKKIDEYSTKLNSLRDNASQISSIADEYEKLRTNAFRTNDEQARFIDLQNQIHAILPTVSGEYDDMGNYVLDASVNIKSLTDDIRDQIVAMQELQRQKVMAGESLEIENLKKLQQEQKNLNNLIANPPEARQTSPRVRGAAGAVGQQEINNLKDLTKAQEQSAQKANDLIVAIDGMRVKYLSLDPVLRMQYLNNLKLAGISSEVIMKIAEGTVIAGEQIFTINNLDTALEHYNSTLGDTAAKAGMSDDDLKKLNDTLKTLTGTTEELNSISKDDRSEKGLSNTAVLNLISSHSEYIQFLKIENGQIVLDIGAIREYNQNLIASAIITAQAAGATEQEIAALQLLFQVAIGGAVDSSKATKAASGATIDYAANVKTMLDKIVSMIRQQKEAEKAAFQQEIEDYTKIINAQKNKLKLLHDEQDYRDELADKEKAVSDTQIQLDALALDNSEEAKKRRLELESELAKETKALGKTQRDKQYEDQQSALDKELQSFKDKIQIQIDAIDKYLSEPGQIMAEAIEMLRTQSGTLYEQLIAWNSVYGDGIQANIVKAWNDAIAAIQKYSSIEGALASEKPTGGSGGSDASDNQPSTNVGQAGWNTPGAAEPEYNPYYAEGGVVSGGIPGRDSVHKMLTPGEFVLNKKTVDSVGISMLNRLNSTGGMPATTSMGGKGLTIGTLLSIPVSGNLDKNVIPDIKKIADKVMGEMNKALMERGWTRATNQYIS